MSARIYGVLLLVIWLCPSPFSIFPAVLFAIGRFAVMMTVQRDNLT